MRDGLAYEVVVVGGGPAGLTTGLYATRLGHRTAVFEQSGGRHAAVANVHNLFGVSEDVSGAELAARAAAQFEEYGGDFHPDAVTDVRLAHGETDAAEAEGEAATDAPSDSRFVVESTHATVGAERVVFATGFTDRGPSVPGLERFTGRGLHYCLHCDAYALGDAPVFVLGHDDHAAEVAMVLLNFTGDVSLLLDGEDPDWSESTARQIAAHPVEWIDAEVVGAYPEADEDAVDPPQRSDPTSVPAIDGPWLGGLTFADGTERSFLGGFAIYGRSYDADLAASLGCARTDDGAVAVDADGETSVDGAYAVGDVTHGQNQTPIALGDGARAGIAIHCDLRRFPIDADELDPDADPAALDAPAAAAPLRARMRRNRGRERHAGLRPPDEGE